MISLKYQIDSDTGAIVRSRQGSAIYHLQLDLLKLINYMFYICRPVSIIAFVFRCLKKERFEVADQAEAVEGDEVVGKGEGGDREEGGAGGWVKRKSDR